MLYNEEDLKYQPNLYTNICKVSLFRLLIENIGTTYLCYLEPWLTSSVSRCFWHCCLM